MTLFQKIVTGALALLLIWAIAMTFFPFFVDGFFYTIESPVPVYNVTEDSVYLSFQRWARFPMNGFCTRELVCDYTIELGQFPCPIEKGYDAPIFWYALPDIVSQAGDCFLRGHVQYRPFGNFGPELTTPWESEVFTLDAN